MVLPLVGRRHARPRGLLATLLVLRPTNNDETPSSPPPWNQSVSRSFRGVVSNDRSKFVELLVSSCAFGLHVIGKRSMLPRHSSLLAANSDHARNMHIEVKHEAQRDCFRVVSRRRYSTSRIWATNGQRLTTT